MSIRLTCNRCSQVYEAPPQLAGKNIQCRKCGQLIPVPGHQAAPQAAPADPLGNPAADIDPLAGLVGPPTTSASAGPPAPGGYGGPPTAFGGPTMGPSGTRPKSRSRGMSLKGKLIALGLGLGMAVFMKIILPSFRQKPSDADTAPPPPAIQLEADGRRPLPKLEPVTLSLGDEIREISQVVLVGGSPPRALVTKYAKHTLECYDLKSGQQLMSTRFSDKFMIADVSPNQKQALILPRGSKEGDSFQLQAIDAASEPIEPRLRSGGRSRVGSTDWAAFAGDGDVLVYSQRGSLCKYRVSGGDPVYELDLEHQARLALSPGRRYLAVIESEATVVDVATGKVLGLLPRAKGAQSLVNDVWYAEFSPNGRWLAALINSNQNQIIVVWDVTTGEFHQHTTSFEGPLAWLQDELLVYETARKGQRTRELSGKIYGPIVPEHAQRFNPATLEPLGEIYIMGWPAFGSFNSQFWYAGGPATGPGFPPKVPPATLYNVNIPPGKVTEPMSRGVGLTENGQVLPIANQP